MVVVKERAQAKINLGLAVKDKLPNGYHQIDTVMVSVDLADKIYLELRRDGKIAVRCTHPHIPEGFENIAHKAAALIQQDYQVADGVTITIEKNIPVAAGLAGGSADAAAILRRLPGLWGIRVSGKDMCRWAQELGTDVAFCLQGGIQRGRGLGDDLKPIPNRCHFDVALMPQPYRVSTASVYKDWKRIPGSMCDMDVLCQALAEGDSSKVIKTMCNDLQAVTCSQIPQLKEKIALLQRGGVSTFMSGSGPTLFAIGDANTLLECIHKVLPQQEVVLCRPIFSLLKIEDFLPIKAN